MERLWIRSFSAASIWFPRLHQRLIFLQEHATRIPTRPPRATSSRRSFSSLANALMDRSDPELQYLTRWASIKSYGASWTLLDEILPIGAAMSCSSVRNAVLRMGQRDALVTCRRQRVATDSMCHIEWPVSKTISTMIFRARSCERFRDSTCRVAPRFCALSVSGRVLRSPVLPRSPSIGRKLCRLRAPCGRRPA